MARMPEQLRVLRPLLPVSNFAFNLLGAQRVKLLLRMRPTHKSVGVARANERPQQSIGSRAQALSDLQDNAALQRHYKHHLISCLNPSVHPGELSRLRCHDASV